MSNELFSSLNIYRDGDFRSAAMNMAIDEALLEIAVEPSIRFYRWDHRSLSFGYFGRYSQVAMHEIERDIVRRWTGGGIVFHGEDLTYSLVVPRNHSAFAESPLSIYENVHVAMQRALSVVGQNAQLAVNAIKTTDNSGPCFANPVRADVLLNGKKIAGAAQRRTRAGLLQQGSIQDVDVPPDFELLFGRQIGEWISERRFDSELIDRATEIAERKYGTSAWLRRR